MHYGVLLKIIMFTIGREREKEHSNRYLRNPEHRCYIHSVIDVVHDCLDDSYDPEAVRKAFRSAFLDGRSGVWEQTGSWLAKLCNEFPEFSDLWLELSKNKKVDLRFRAAAHLQSMPEEHFSDMLRSFSVDRSKKIRSKVAGDFGVDNCPVIEGLMPFLIEWRDRESDKEVEESINYAIKHQSQAQ